MPDNEILGTIVREVENGVLEPSDILEKLGGQFSDFQIKEGILRLLREGDLELTSDRKLHQKRAA